MLVKLASLTLDDAVRYGGKAANLGFLINQGFPVPRGIALSLTSLDEVDLIGLAQLVDPSKCYSVRSSGTAEDGEAKSFAGQYETVLGVRPPDLIHAVQTVYESRQGARALHYTGQEAQEGVFGIVIQEMVAAEISGIMFTADPLDSNRQVLCIESAYGLGESIVSGRVDTDRYRVEKASLEILDVKTRVKKEALKFSDGRLETIEMADDSPSLKYEQVLQVARLGIAIEQAYGKPQDIEFAIDSDGKIMILQSRPVTTLWPGIPDVPDDHLLINFNAVQMMMEPFTPLGAAIIQDVARLSDRSFLHFVRGYGYVDLSPLLNNRFLRPIVVKALKSVDEEARQIIMRQTPRSEGLWADLGMMAGVVRFLAPKVIRARWRMGTAHGERLEMGAMALAERFAQEMDKAKDHSLSIDDSFEKMRQVLRGLLRQLFDELMPTIMGAMMLRRRLIHRYGQEVVDQADRGLSNNLTARMGRSIDRLADALVRSGLPCDGPEAIMEALKADQACCRIYREVIETFGFRGIGEIDIANPRYQEEAGPLATMLTDAVKARRRGFQNGKDAMDQDEVARLVESYGASIQRYRTLIGMREHPKYVMSKMLMKVRQTALEIGRDFVGKGWLDDPSEIFYLTPREITAPPRDMKQRITERHAEWEDQRRKVPPKVMDGSGRAYRHRPKCGPGTLVGTAASAGRILAQIRVVRTIEEASDLEGKILVTRFTDPGWTPAFNHIAGLVTEVGGFMTHGSVVAREYGIPAVVGVSDAMAHLTDGMWVELDGYTGEIRLVPAEKINGQ